MILWVGVKWWDDVGADCENDGVAWYVRGRGGREAFEFGSCGNYCAGRGVSDMGRWYATDGPVAIVGSVTRLRPVSSPGLGPDLGGLCLVHVDILGRDPGGTFEPGSSMETAWSGSMQGVIYLFQAGCVPSASGFKTWTGFGRDWKESLERRRGAHSLAFRCLVRRGQGEMSNSWRADTAIVEMTDPLAVHPVPAPLVFPHLGNMGKDHRCGVTVSYYPFFLVYCLGCLLGSLLLHLSFDEAGCDAQAW